MKLTQYIDKVVKMSGEERKLTQDDLASVVDAPWAADRQTEAEKRMMELIKLWHTTVNDQDPDLALRLRKVSPIPDRVRSATLTTYKTRIITADGKGNTIAQETDQKSFGFLLEYLDGPYTLRSAEELDALLQKNGFDDEELRALYVKNALEITMPPGPATSIVTAGVVHEMWKQVQKYGTSEDIPQHPLAPLIDAGLSSPERVKPDDIPVAPFAISKYGGRSDRKRNRYPGPVHIPNENPRITLPGFTIDHDYGIYLAEEIYRLAEKEKTRSGYVSKTQRALIYALLRTPPKRSTSPTGYWFDVPGKEYVEVTHQANKQPPKPHVWVRDLRATRTMLAEVDIPYTNADGEERRFTPVAIMDTPDDPDGSIEFVTKFPQEYGGLGVRVSEHIWHFTNWTSAFFMILSAPFLYEQPGITFKPRKGGGVQYFKDIEAYPILKPGMIAIMSSPLATGRARRHIEQNAYALIEKVAKQSGAFQIAKRKDVRIILPPRIDFSKSTEAKGFDLVKFEYKDRWWK